MQDSNLNYLSALWKVKFLGHVVSEQGHALSLTKLKALSNLLSPTNGTEVKSLIGLDSYYRRFIKNFALHQLMQKGHEFKWIPGCQEAFMELWRLLTPAPVVVFPDYTLPFRLYMEISLFAIGAVLAHVREDREHITVCASCFLTTPEKNYIAIKCECFVIVWALQHFQPYIAETHTTIIMDPPVPSAATKV